MCLQLPRFMQEVVYIEQINRCLTCLDPSAFHHAYLRCVDKETVTAQLHGPQRPIRYTVKYWEVHTQPQGLTQIPDSAGSWDYSIENTKMNIKSFKSLKIEGLKVTIVIYPPDQMNTLLMPEQMLHFF